MMLLYSFALAVGLTVAAPWWLTRMVTTARYREGLRGRLGAVPATLRAFVAGKRVVWVHAVSVGEVLAASRLVGELEAGLTVGAGKKAGVLRLAQDDAEEQATTGLIQDWVVVVSTTTRTGQALARERFGAERVFYFPLDFAFAVRAYLRVLQPAALVLMESELWPRVLHECGRARVPVVVVNARVSDRSFARGMRMRGVWRPVLGKVSLWLAQSEEDARRLVAMGGSEAAVKVGGNLKYDVRAPKESRVAGLIREAAAGRPVVVAGSTVAGVRGEEHSEDEMILGTWREVRELGSAALLVLAPRHPERFGAVAAMLNEFQYIRASDWGATTEGTPPFAKGAMDGPPSLVAGPPEAGARLEVVLLDTIGDLAAVYGIADVAFVGGSLVTRGGHNPLEPAQFGVPAVMGQSFENFREIVEKLRSANAIRIVPDADELGAQLLQLLMDPKWAGAIGERGRRVFEEQQGATSRAVEAIVALVQQ